MVFIFRAETGGGGIDMDDGRRVLWRLVLSQEHGKKKEGNRSIWFRCNV